VPRWFCQLHRPDHCGGGSLMRPTEATSMRRSGGRSLSKPLPASAITGRRAIPLRHPCRRFRPGWRNQSVRTCAEVAGGNLRDELSLASRVWRSASRDGDRCRHVARLRTERVRVLSNCWSCQQSLRDPKTTPFATLTFLSATACGNLDPGSGRDSSTTARAFQSVMALL